nr:hypothetical protein [uncultured bacterium]
METCWQHPVSCDNRIFFRGRSGTLAEVADDPTIIGLDQISEEAVRAEWEARINSLRIASATAARLPEYQRRPGQSRFDIFDIASLDCYEIKKDNPREREAGRNELDHRIEVYQGSELGRSRQLVAGQWRPVRLRPGVTFPFGIPGQIAQITLTIPFFGSLRVLRYPKEPGIVCYQLIRSRDQSIETLREAYREALRMRRSVMAAKVYVEIGATMAAAVVGSVVVASAGAEAIAALSGEAAAMESVAATTRMIASLSAEGAEAAEMAQVEAMLAEAIAAARTAMQSQGVLPLVGALPMAPLAVPSIMAPSIFGPPQVAGPLALPSVLATPLQVALDKAKAALEAGGAAIRWMKGLPDQVDHAVQDLFQHWDDELTESVVWDVNLPAFRTSQLPPVRFDLGPGHQPRSSYLPGGTPGSPPGDVPFTEPAQPESGGVAASTPERQRQLEQRLDRSAATGIAEEVVAALEWAGNAANPLFDPTQAVVTEFLEMLVETTPGGLPAALASLGVIRPINPAEPLNPRDRLQWPAVAAALLSNRQVNLLTLLGVTEFLVTADDAVIADMVGGADEEEVDE